MFTRLQNWWLAWEQQRLGMACWHALKLDPARRHFETALKLDPNRSDTWHSLGWMHGYQGNVEDAVRAWTRAIELEPHYVKAYLARSWGHLCAGRRAEARADLDAAIRLNPRLGDAWNQRAELLWQEGDFDRSVAEATKSLSLEPRNARALHTRAFAQLHRGALVEAAGDWSKAIALNPRDMNAYYGRAVCHTLRHEWEDALRDLDLSRTLTPAGESHRDFCVLKSWMVELRRQRTTYRKSASVRLTEVHVRDLQTPWIQVLGAVVLGEESLPHVEAKIAESPESMRKGFACQAYYHLGFRSLMENDAAEAARRFQRCRETSRFDHYDYALASHELRILGTPAAP